MSLARCVGSRVSDASDFRDAQFESGLVAAIVIAHELAAPRSHELSGMFAGTAAGEVVDHGLQIGEWRRAVRPPVSPMRLALAVRQHLHRRLVGVQHVALQELFAKRIDQRLQPYLDPDLRQPRRRRRRF